MEKTLYFVRHGETDYNRMKIVQGRGVDAPLNETGIMQARAFYDHYHHVPFEAVFTSTLIRTHQTVEPFIHKSGRWIVSPDIDEIGWGTHEGRKGTPAMLQRYDEMIREWQRGNLDASLPDGESAASLYHRISRFLKELTRRTETNILVCTHGRTLRCLMCIWKNEPPGNMELYDHANTGVFKLKWDGRFHLLSENDTAHLNRLYQSERNNA